MDTSVFGVSNSVPVRLKWLIWTIGSYSIYRECVRSDIESARENMLLLGRRSRLWILTLYRICINGMKRWHLRSYAAEE